ncbi:hypothetical protein ACL02U_05270 [Streptomyces sp. MS06]|uniref:hypothetical protein n=1 Tax=Streptomyces sp. MS06 TaxID=3385974 RepID=UPI0039A052C0
MSVRFAAKRRRGMAALTLVAGLVVGAAGCGSGGSADSGDSNKHESSASTSSATGSQPSAQERDSEAPLAELKGTSGLLLQITSAQREAGGFVTVNGNLKNDGPKRVTVPALVRGDETEILRHGMSLGGATLIDDKEKKRYYVLRDTDGRPLTTTGFSSIKPGDSLPVFMQFPAPPASTTQVTFQLPTFASAAIQISG